VVNELTDGTVRDKFGQFAAGNQAAAQARRLHHALERALARDNWKRLNAGCDRLAESFADGQPWALQMVFDRLAGKAVARIEHVDSDTRELDLASIMRLVMQARSTQAEDAVPRETLALPSDTPTGIPDST